MMKDETPRGPNVLEQVSTKILWAHTWYKWCKIKSFEDKFNKSPFLSNNYIYPFDILKRTYFKNKIMSFLILVKYNHVLCKWSCLINDFCIKYYCIHIVYTCSDGFVLNIKTLMGNFIYISIGSVFLRH